nr:dTDP-4-dehydrorhamnose 3,5-epimerase family protein [Enterobacter asburiae]
MLWNDEDIGVNWPKEGNLILSKKDKDAPLMSLLIKSKII